MWACNIYGLQFTLLDGSSVKQDCTGCGHTHCTGQVTLATSPSVPCTQLTLVATEFNQSSCLSLIACILLASCSQECKFRESILCRHHICSGLRLLFSVPYALIAPDSLSFNCNPTACV
jgi:hypothetical protein